MQIGYNRHQIPAESQDLVPQTSKSLESSGCLFVCLLPVCFGFPLIISGCVKHAVADVTQICWMAKGQTGK